MIVNFEQKTKVEPEHLIGDNFFELIVLTLFFISFVIQLIYLFVFYIRLFFLKDPDNAVSETPVTLLLTVRNEEKRIDSLLDGLSAINYGLYEIVVVDDFSEDRTLQVLGSLSQRYPKLRFTSLSQDNRYSQKLSISLGLRASKTDWILFLPVSAKMGTGTLFNLNNSIAEDTELVIGYSNYLPNQGLSNGLNRMERFVGFIRSAAYSLSGFPLLFSQNKLHQYVADLELVFNDAFERTGVSLERIIENERAGMQDYSNLIKKEIFIRRACNWKKRLLLLIEDFSNVLFLFSFILLLLIKTNLVFYLVGIFLVPNIFNFFLVRKIVVRLNEEKIFLSSFLYLLLKPLVNVFQASAMFIQDRRNKWN